jgi:hypothetical protein
VAIEAAPLCEYYLMNETSTYRMRLRAAHRLIQSVCEWTSDI